MAKLNIPDKNKKIPNPDLPELCYIKNCITRKNISAGDYTYYDDKLMPTNFEKHVTHHYPFIGDHLKIGKFCQIAEGVEFMMNGANHILNGFTTYPFYIFGKDWAKHPMSEKVPNLKGDTVVGNDVWIGHNVTILPGVKIGNGVIIGACSVVTKNLPDYCVACGNPARVVKYRFDKKVIHQLLKIKWWDWPVEKITKNIDILMGNDLKKLLTIA